MLNQNKMMYSVRDVTDYLSISSSCLYTSTAKKRKLTCTVTNNAGLVATKTVYYTVTAE